MKKKSGNNMVINLGKSISMCEYASIYFYLFQHFYEKMDLWK